MSRIKIVTKREAEESIVDRQERISWWRQDVVRDARVLVIGAGAIGNAALVNLALTGFGHIMICDMDTISTSNLSRTVLFRKEDVGQYKAQVAAERTKEMSVCPDVEVDYFIGDIMTELGNGIFRQFDVVLGCLDNLEARRSVNKRCNLLQIPFVDGGIDELRMSVATFHYPHSSCWACSVSSQQLANERMRRFSCDGKRLRNLMEGKIPTTQISTSIAGAMIVQETVKILHGMVKSQFGKRYFFDGVTNSFEAMRVPSRSYCPFHHSYDKVIPTAWSSRAVLKDFLAWVSEQNGGEACYLDTAGDHKFTFTGRCKNCGELVTYNKPDYEIYSEDIYCDACKEAKQFGLSYLECDETDAFYAADERVCNRTLKQLGVPDAHILVLRSCEDDRVLGYYELTADVPSVLTSITTR